MSAQDKFNYYVSQVDKELSKYPALNNLEQKTQVPKAYSVLGAAALFSILIFFNVFAGFLSNLLGWAVPAFFSFKALESPGHNDDQQWLTYWVIYGGFTFVESFIDVILYWFPFYYTFKVAFIIYLILPSTRGAEVMYGKLLKPFASQLNAKTSSTPAPAAAAPAPQ